MNTICVMLNSDYNVTLLTRILEPTYRVTVATGENFSHLPCDLFIMDYETLDKSLSKVKIEKEMMSPHYLPVLLLIPQGKLAELPEEVWNTIDDILEMPLHKKRLYLTVNTLLRVKNYALQLHDADSARNKFFSIITHDLKNPFGALVTLSEIMIKQYDHATDADKKHFVHRIHDNVSSTLKLLENLLQWSKVQTGRLEGCFERINLKVLIKHSINVFHETALEKGINLRLEMTENVMTYADVNMLTAVIRNLVSNAIKFTPHHGEIKISAQEQEHVVEVTVADNGIGIKNEDLSKLFRIDIKHSTIGTNGEHGTGLGLIICKEFVEKNGGKLWVESQWGAGSCFKFSLPKAATSKVKNVALHKTVEKATTLSST